MGHGHKVSCVLCQGDKETKITGPLSTKDQVTAHQNCLLYSSGIFCRDSPQFDDLFGFSVDDVLDEVKRGSKLICSRCKKKGATAGCEVKRCKKSYHYPCAILEGAKVFEDSEREYFWLYCSKHQQQQEKDSTVNGCASSLTKPGTSKNPSEAGPSKKRNTNGDSSAAGPSACSSDSNSSSSIKRSHTKRPLSSGNKRGEPSPKRTPESWSRILTDDSSEPDEPDADIAIFAPLESDIDGSVGSQVESQLTRNNSHPTESASGNHVEDESKDGNKDDDETDVESESLLPPVRRSAEPQPHSMTTSSPEPRPVHSPDPHTAGPSAPQQSSTSPPPSPNLSRPCSVTRRAISPAPPETVSPPAALPSDPEPSIDSTSFWKSCNVARCTQAIFTDFINEMNSISSRIQSDQASQEDYDLALRVMEASGKLAEHVAKQQKELQRKQMELQKAAAAMKEVVSALRR